MNSTARCRTKSSYDDNLAGLFSDLGAPLLDDGNAIAQQLSTVFYALSTHQIPVKKAYMMLYNLQIAISNLKNVRPPDTQYDSCATEDPNPIQLMPGLEAVADRARKRAQALNRREQGDSPAPSPERAEPVERSASWNAMAGEMEGRNKPAASPDKDSVEAVGAAQG